tara:strand:+ start:402 stop:593 length:192 start_codon:yes stop_codon:yes gene_type:complete
MSECEHNSLSETGRDSHFIKGSSTYHYIEHICDDCGEYVYEKYRHLGTYSREEIGDEWTYYEL